jgi:hypothetical protein
VAYIFFFYERKTHSVRDNLFFVSGHSNSTEFLPSLDELLKGVDGFEKITPFECGTGL